MIHGVLTLNREDNLEKLSLKLSQDTEFLSNSLHAHMEESPSENASLLQKEFLDAEDIMEEGKALLKNVLSAVKIVLFDILKK